MKKKYLRSTLLIVILAALFLIACSPRNKEGKKWDCTVTIPENSNEIVLSDTLIKTTSGELNIQNHTDLDIIWYLYDSENIEEPVGQMNVKPAGAGVLYQLEADIQYRVGIQADSSSERDVTVIVAEYPNSEPYTIEQE